MEYTLPKEIEVNGERLKIRYDYRAVLDIFEALNDPELDGREKSFVALRIFYFDFHKITDYDAAIKSFYWFVNGGVVQEEKPAQKIKRLVSWEQDFNYIVAPINRVIGHDIRDDSPLHWWSFLSAYMEIGDCLFAQIVRIRDKKSNGKPLDKFDREFYRKNKDIVDIKTRYTGSDDALISMWT